MEKVSDTFSKHYRQTFKDFGTQPRGVDWNCERNALKRIDYFIRPIREGKKCGSILDVGCGYGAFHQELRKAAPDPAYTGIDMVEEMLVAARSQSVGQNSEFIQGDFLSHDFGRRFDYVFCSGLFTQKLTIGEREMDQFVGDTIDKMFQLSDGTVACNFLTDFVDYRKETNYHTPIPKILGHIARHTRKFEIIHTSDFYEYFVFLYR